MNYYSFLQVYSNRWIFIIHDKIKYFSILVKINIFLINYLNNYAVSNMLHKCLCVPITEGKNIIL